MRNIIKISFPKKNQILCQFDNGENKILDLTTLLKDQYGKRVLREDLYDKAKVGSMGEIVWEKLAEIKNLDGEPEPCDYDISPEFAYHHSVTQQ